MSDIIFCTTCGSKIPYNVNLCSCGNSMSILEKNQINSNLQKINNYQIVNSNLKAIAQDSFSNLTKYKLDKVYLQASSATNAYQRKINFIQKELIPTINNWKEDVQNAEKCVIKDKVEVYGRIIGITEFVLKEFFGPFSIKENGSHSFTEYSDFGRFKLSEIMHDANLDFSDIQTTNFGTIGSSVMKSVEHTLKNGSFNEIAKRSEWSKSDIKTVKTELAVVIATELIQGIAGLITQNVQAIKNVREADNQLNRKISNISQVISSLNIEENEINKQKKLLDKSELILDYCFEKVLKPIVDQLQNDKIYQQYKINRLPYDLQQNKIRLEEELLSDSVKVSFWGCLLNSRNKNYKTYWNKRARNLNKIASNLEINEALNEKNHESLIAFYKYKELKTNDFKEFEKINRRILKTLPAISNNSSKVVQFAGVLKEVKLNLNQ